MSTNKESWIRRAILLSLIVVLAAVAISAGLAWVAKPPPDPWQPVRDLIAQEEFEAAGEKIRQLDPQSINWRSHWLRARIYRYTGRMAEARVELLEAFRMGADVETLEREQLFCLAMSGEMSKCESELNRLLADPRGEPLEIARSYILGFYLSQRFDKAHVLVEAWRKDYPNDAEPWYLKGRAYDFSDNSKDAAECFRTGLALNPRHWRMRLALAEVLDSDVRLEEAFAEYQQVVEQVPHLPKPWLKLGLLHIRLGDAEAALTCLEELKRMKAPEDLQMQLEAAYVATQSDWKRVEELTTRLLEHDPNTPGAMVLLLRAYTGLGKRDEAAALVEKLAVAKNRNAKLQLLFEETITRPRDADLLVEIGDESRAAGIDANGYPWYLAAAELDPNCKVAHERLARHYRELGNVERAEEYEEKAKKCPERTSPASKASTNKS